MRNKNKNIHSKDMCIGKMVTIFNAVVSMEFKALGNMICFHNYLCEKLISNETLVRGIITHLELDKC